LVGDVRKDGDREAWTGFFPEGVATSADEAITAARDVIALVACDRQRLLAAGGASVTAARLLESLPVHPVISIPSRPPARPFSSFKALAFWSFGRRFGRDERQAVGPHLRVQGLPRTASRGH
jgi:hypothetical protein